MTEGQWFSGSDLQGMLAALGSRASNRKLRLFAVACCRRCPSWMKGPGDRTALATVADYADGLGDERSLRDSRNQLDFPAWWAAWDPTWIDGAAAVRYLAEALPATAGGVALVRDIFANPFRPPTVISQAWLRWSGGTLRQLAQAAYAAADPQRGSLDATRLAVLADALEEAGCTDADLLGHCRRPGDHIRGCWALDLLLEKT